MRSPFLKIGTILAVFQSAGRVPVSNDCSKIIDSGSVTAAAHYLSNMGWMSSGPEDLSGFRFMSFLITVDSSKFSSASFQHQTSSQNTYIFTTGRFEASSTVNTSWK